MLPEAASLRPRRPTSNALDPAIWPTSAERVDGVLHVGGVAGHRPGRRARHAGLLLDEDDLRARARAYRDRVRRAPTSTTPARRSCAPTVARWIAEEGLGLDVCTGGELAVALAAGFPAGADRAARQQQVRRRAPAAPSTPASAGSSSTRSTRSPGWPRSPRRPASGSGCWSGSRSASRRTPTSSSPPRTRTRSSASRCATARRCEAVAAVLAAPSLRTGRPALPHRLADLRHRRLRGRRAPRGRAARRRSATSTASSWPSSTSAAASASPTSPATTRQTPKQTRRPAARDRRARVRCRRPAPCRGCRVEPGRAIVGPSGVTLYEVGTVKPVTLDGGSCAPTSPSTAG